MSEKFVLATHNANKLREMSDILSKLGVQVVSPADLGITVDVEETEETFAGNAMLKAKAAPRRACPPSPTIPASVWTPSTAVPGSTPPATAGRSWTTGGGIPCC